MSANSVPTAPRSVIRESLRIGGERVSRDRIVEVPKPSNDLLEALYNRALAVSDRDQIEPILAELRIACRKKSRVGKPGSLSVNGRVVEQDPKRRLELVSEISRLFAAREKRLAGHAAPKPPDKTSRF